MYIYIDICISNSPYFVVLYLCSIFGYKYDELFSSLVC